MGQDPDLSEKKDLLSNAVRGALAKILEIPIPKMYRDFMDIGANALKLSLRMAPAEIKSSLPNTGKSGLEWLLEAVSYGAEQILSQLADPMLRTLGAKMVEIGTSLQAGGDENGFSDQSQ